MKRIGIIFGAIFCIFAAYGVTETITWHIDNTTSTTTCESGGDIILPTAPTKYGYTFLGWSEYVPIEYIENTGNINLDLGITAGNNTIKFSVDVKPISGFSDSSLLFSCGDDGGSTGGSANIGVHGNKWNMLLPGTSYNEFANVTTNKIQFDFTVNNGNASATGDLVHTTNHDNYKYNQAWRYRHCYIRLEHNFRIRFYSIKIYINNTIVRDIIPVLDYADVPCMYDKVSNQYFYRNFTAGPVL